MLTAIRELAEEAEAGGDLAAVVARGDDCVARTRELLPVLAEAGRRRRRRGRARRDRARHRGRARRASRCPLPALEAQTASTADSIHQQLSRFRYCTVFVVEGDRLDADALEARARAARRLAARRRRPERAQGARPHRRPGRALSLGVARGTIAGVEIANMHAQTLEREQRLLHAVPGAEDAHCALVVVASGPGTGGCSRASARTSSTAGRTMNPSTAELLAAVEAAGAPEVDHAAERRNVFLAAEHAAEAAPKPVRSCRPSSLQAGLAAVVAFDPGADARGERRRDGRLAADVATGAVTIASRDVDTNGVAIRKGAWLGLADGRRSRAAGRSTRSPAPCSSGCSSGRAGS